MRGLRHKTIIILLIILAVLYFSSDFALIDIEDTAIIVAMGVDKTDDGYEISAQIGLPQATQQTSDNNDTIISAKGKTIMDAVEVLGTQTGWHPKLAFCNLIILGKGFEEQDITPLIDNMLASEKIQNSALLAFTKSSAKEVLTAVTPLDAISSFAIQKILLRNDRTLSTVADTNIKNFSILNHGRGNWGYMPVISMVKGSIEGEESGGAGKTSGIFDKNTLLFNQKYCNNRPIAPLLDNYMPSGSYNITTLESGGSDASQAGGKSGKPENVVFDASYTALFLKGRLVDYLNAEETICYNLLNSPADQILLEAKTPNGIVMLEVFSSKHKVKVVYGAYPTIKLDLDLSVRFTDSTTDINGEALGRQASVPKEYLQSLKQSLSSTLAQMTERVYKKGVDLFDARELTYRNYHKNYDDLKDLPLDKYVIKIDVKVSSKD